MNLQTFYKHFELLADAPNAVAKLREMILQLAVQGKLVPQDPKDEPAAVLLEKIQAEKEKRIKQGKIKKSKPLPPITPEEVPYELPEGWEWVRLGEIQNFINGYAFKSQDYKDSGIGIVRIGDLVNGQISELNMKYLSPSAAKLLNANLFVRKNDLLIAMSGATTGKLGFNKTNKEYLLNQRVGKFDIFLIDKNYLYFFLNTKIKDNLQISAGSAIPNLSTSQINNLALPLPPLSEQHRIASKVDQLMALCDELETRQQKKETTRARLNQSITANLLTAPTPKAFTNGWQRLCHNFDLLYDTPETIPTLRQTILQLAVQGKLAPQDPNDEPASALLEKIKTEKEKRIKQGKIKKSKPLPPVTPEEVPYELPEGWEWTRLSDLGIINPRNVESDNTLASFVPMPSISEKYGVEVTSEIRPWGEIKKGYTHFAENDVALAKITPCFQNGKSAIMRNLKNGIGAGTTELHVFRPIINEMLSAYILLYFKSPRFIQDGIPKMTGSAGQKRVPKNYFANNPFPLPPSPEQHRIAAKVEQLMALCDQLEEKLTQSTASSQQLTEAVIHHLTAA